MQILCVMEMRAFASHLFIAVNRTNLNQDPCQTLNMRTLFSKKGLKMLHQNIRSLQGKFDKVIIK